MWDSMLAAQPSSSSLLPGGGPWEGEVIRVRFHNPDNGFSIVEMQVDSGEIATVKGVMFGAGEGIRVRVTGEEVNDPKWGPQIKAGLMEQLMPTTAQEIRAYLASGQIAGIGAVLANRIVDVFGDDTLRVLDSDIDRLAEVPGIGPATLTKIRTAWETTGAAREVMLRLSGAGVTPGVAARIVRHFGDEAATVLRTNPYRLLAVNGIGWSTADTLAYSAGIAPDAPERFAAGIAHVVEVAHGEGHCYLTLFDMVQRAKGLLLSPPPGCTDRVTLTPAILKAEFDRLVTEETLIKEDTDAGEIVYTGAMWRCETELADLVAVLAAPGEDVTTMAEELGQLSPSEWERLLGPDEEGRALAPEQADAVRAALMSGFSVVTGGPGCGKSFTVARMVQAARQYGCHTLLAAPTGKAAKRLKQLTDGADAKTVHRLLGHGPTNPEDDVDEMPDAQSVICDLLVVDETSMVDVWLARRLLGQIPVGTHVVFIGDIDQLPSIGPGSVLRDLIDSDAVPVTRLTRVFRQAEKSGITQAAHAINAGIRPDTIGTFGDLQIRYAENSQDAVAMAEELITKELPARGFPAAQVPILTPQRKSAAGVNALNEHHQKVLNPAAPHKNEVTHGNRVFRVGDRIMQIRNNYDKNVFNGTSLRIESIEDEDNTKIITAVSEDGDVIEYTTGELDQVMLGYAWTIHKSQGSEFPAVVIMVMPEASFMLRRNLLYTALTRAKQHCVIITTPSALSRTVRSQDTDVRNTRLAWRLRHA